jgi:tetratricopeptide (TPR) repeat protein
MRQNPPAAAAPAPEMRRFIAGAGLLVVVLLGFFALLLPFSDRTAVTPPEVNVLDQLTESKREMLRHAMRAEVAHLRDDVDSSAAPAKPFKAPPAEAEVAPRAPAAEAAGAETGDPDIQKAIQAIDSGNVTDAVALLEGVLKRDPRNEQALVELAMVYMLDLKQPNEAIGYLQRALDVNPENKVVMSELVSLYEEEGRVDDGLSYLMEQAATHPQSPELAYGIGQMLSIQGREGEAIPYLEKAAQSTDNPVRAYRDLAEAYSRSGDPDRAIEAYGRAITQQEKEIQEKAQAGAPTTFAEERLANTKLDQARELIRRGDANSLDAAQKILDDVQTSVPDMDQTAALQESLTQTRKRAG